MQSERTSRRFDASHASPTRQTCRMWHRGRRHANPQLANLFSISTFSQTGSARSEREARHSAKRRLGINEYINGHQRHHRARTHASSPPRSTQPILKMTAIFNFQSLLLVILLFICTSTYIHAIFPSIMDRNKDGIMGIFWKSARIGERLSPYVSLACIAMAVCDGPSSRGSC